jgi:hypothetical protein
MGDFYRIPADNPSLNYASSISLRRINIASIEDYVRNTEQLGVEAAIKYACHTYHLFESFGRCGGNSGIVNSKIVVSI